MQTTSAVFIHTVSTTERKLDIPEAEKVQQKILDGQIAILKGAFSKEQVTKVKEQIWQWSQVTPPLAQGVSGSQLLLTFHRTDDDIDKGSHPHLFAQYAFGSLSSIPTGLKDHLHNMSLILLAAQEGLGGISLSIDDEQVRAKVINHPRGGGFISCHTHPFEPSRIAVFLNLSEPEQDYNSGGLRFFTHDQWIDTYHTFKAGDMVAWRQDLPHSIEPINASSPVTFDTKGFWIFYVEYFPAAKTISYKSL